MKLNHCSETERRRKRNRLLFYELTKRLGVTGVVNKHVCHKHVVELLWTKLTKPHWLTDLSLLLTHLMRLIVCCVLLEFKSRPFIESAAYSAENTVVGKQESIGLGLFFILKDVLPFLWEAFSTLKINQVQSTASANLDGIYLDEWKFTQIVAEHLAY